MLKRFFRNQDKTAEIMVARLHSSKRNVKRGWEEKCLWFLQDYAVIWLFHYQNKGQWLVEWDFFSLTVFGGNFLVGDVHSSIALDRYVQAWQWIDSISLLIWGPLWLSACSLEAWGGSLTFLLLVQLWKGSEAVEKLLFWNIILWKSGSFQKEALLKM